MTLGLRGHNARVFQQWNRRQVPRKATHKRMTVRWTTKNSNNNTNKTNTSAVGSSSAASSNVRNRISIYLDVLSYPNTTLPEYANVSVHAEDTSLWDTFGKVLDEQERYLNYHSHNRPPPVDDNDGSSDEEDGGGAAGHASRRRSGAKGALYDAGSTSAPLTNNGRPFTAAAAKRELALRRTGVRKYILLATYAPCGDGDDNDKTPQTSDTITDVVTQCRDERTQQDKFVRAVERSVNNHLPMRIDKQVFTPSSAVYSSETASRISATPHFAPLMLAIHRVSQEIQCDVL